MSKKDLDIGTEEIEKPIGDFIIKNAKGDLHTDGMYYHYRDVCKLLKLQKKETAESIEEEIINILSEKAQLEVSGRKTITPSMFKDIAKQISDKLKK